MNNPHETLGVVLVTPHIRQFLVSAENLDAHNPILDLSKQTTTIRLHLSTLCIRIENFTPGAIKSDTFSEKIFFRPSREMLLHRRYHLDGRGIFSFNKFLYNLRNELAWQQLVGSQLNDPTKKQSLAVFMEEFGLDDIDTDSLRRSIERQQKSLV